MVDRALFPENVPVEQDDLLFQAETLVQELQERRRALTAPLLDGPVSGFALTSASVASANLTVGPGYGYTPGGDRVELERATLLRLPSTGAFAFGLRIRLEPAEEVVSLVGERVARRMTTTSELLALPVSELRALPPHDRAALMVVGTAVVRALDRPPLVRPALGPVPAGLTAYFVSPVPGVIIESVGLGDPEGVEGTETQRSPAVLGVTEGTAGALRATTPRAPTLTGTGAPEEHSGGGGGGGTLTVEFPPIVLMAPGGGAVEGVDQGAVASVTPPDTTISWSTPEGQAPPGREDQTLLSVETEPPVFTLSISRTELYVSPGTAADPNDCFSTTGAITASGEWTDRVFPLFVLDPEVPNTRTARGFTFYLRVLPSALDELPQVSRISVALQAPEALTSGRPRDVDHRVRASGPPSPTEPHGTIQGRRALAAGRFAAGDWRGEALHRMEPRFSASPRAGALTASDRRVLIEEYWQGNPPIAYRKYLDEGPRGPDQLASARLIETVNARWAGGGYAPDVLVEGGYAELRIVDPGGNDRWWFTALQGLPAGETIPADRWQLGSVNLRQGPDDYRFPSSTDARYATSGFVQTRELQVRDPTGQSDRHVNLDHQELELNLGSSGVNGASLTGVYFRLRNTSHTATWFSSRFRHDGPVHRIEGDADEGEFAVDGVPLMRPRFDVTLRLERSAGINATSLESVRDLARRAFAPSGTTLAVDVNTGAVALLSPGESVTAPWTEFRFIHDGSRSDTNLFAVRLDGGNVVLGPAGGYAYTRGVVHASSHEGYPCSCEYVSGSWCLYLRAGANFDTRVRLVGMA